MKRNEGYKKSIRLQAGGRNSAIQPMQFLCLAIITDYEEMCKHMDEGYNYLINAIIEQAAKDYETAVEKLKNDPESYVHKKLKREVEQFLQSSWFELMTDIDGKWLLTKLEEKTRRSQK